MTTTIRFTTLGLYCHVSRSHKVVGVFSERTGKSVAAIMKQTRGNMLWESFGLRRLPDEIITTIDTMI